jgi:hypothetical protein
MAKKEYSWNIYRLRGTQDHQSGDAEMAHRAKGSMISERG